MAVADDAYMGYMAESELIDELNTLLAAERAGARVAMKSRHDVLAPKTQEFFRSLARDEAACCAMLARHISNLGGIATSDVGAFYQSAMAISDITKRLEFLNRGQGWVVRRLTTMLPRIRNDRIYAELKAMLTTHEQNIDSTTALIQQDAPAS
jgi:hypothetical protein